MNTHQWYQMGLRSIQPPNTFIGGVSATISTPALLASKLGISVGLISNFTVVGSDIQCRITGSYTLSAAFLNDTTITSFIDSDNLVSMINETFKGCLNLAKLQIKNLTTISSGNTVDFENTKIKLLELPVLTSKYSFSNMPSIERIYVPLCTVISTFSLYQASGRYNFIIYVHPSLSTSNGGGVDAELAAFISAGGTVRYVTNFTSPNPVTTLAAETIYSTAIQLNFTVPSSTNTIDYYECYVNGVLKNTITGSGQYITGLIPSTSYNITIIAVDIFYNKSAVSNSLSVSTNTTSAVPTTGLVSYYKLDSNSNDSYGTNNGTDTSVTYVSGKVNNSASYNGSTSKTIIGNPANTQISVGTISCWIKTSAAGSSYRSVFGKTLAYNIFLENGIFIVYNWGSFGGSGNKSSGVNLNDGLWHHIAFVFDSGTANNYLYLDGVLKLTFSWSVSNQTGNVCIGSSNSIQNINALIDESSIYNVKLTQNQIDLIYNLGTGITL